MLSDPASPDTIIIEFTDAVTAGDGAKRAEMLGKGKLACETSLLLLRYLQQRGIATHLVEKLDGPRLRCRRVEILPVEVVCRNIAAGSVCRRYGIEQGTVFKRPVVEFFLKDDALGDPLVTPEVAVQMGLATEDELAFIRSVTLSVNYYVRELMRQVKLTLVDFKLEFGRTPEGELLVADEISGDTMRVWDETSTSLDKDLFRKSTGDLVSAYVELLERLVSADTKAVGPRTERIVVEVMPKRGVKNPPGEVTMKALRRLGMKGVQDVRVGKLFVISLDRPVSPALMRELEAMNLKLLSNPVAETHHVRL